MHAIGVILTLICIVLIWREIIKRRDQIDYIHLLSAIIFTFSLIYISADFGYSAINPVAVLILIVSAIVGATHKSSSKTIFHRELTKNQLIALSLGGAAIIILGLPLAQAAHIGLECGFLVSGPNADTITCKIISFVGLILMIISTYAPVLVITGIVVTIIMLATKKR